MEGRRLVAAAVAALLTGVTGARAQDASRTGPRGPRGAADGAAPDLVIQTLPEMKYVASSGPLRAYAIGVHVCNVGDAPAEWYGNTDRHPLMAQNLYRLKDGRFEHIGQSWVKHTSYAENEHSCGPCQQPGSQWLLGIRCGDVYAAGMNASQFRLGPKSQVNPTTGVYPYPFTAPAVTSTMDRRLRVLAADVDPALNAAAVYIAEARVISPDEAAAGNGLDNASYARASDLMAAEYMTLGPTRPGDPAILAWKEFDPEVAVATADYTDTSTGSPITARFWVAGRARATGTGAWRYEYAVYNHNAHRAAGSFSVPLGTGVTVTSPGHKAPEWHSGEPYSNAAWGVTVSAGAATWATAAFTADPNASAVRWGTLVNFWFDADAPPATGSATLGLFAPGSPDSLPVHGLPVPGVGGGTPPCYANCDGSIARPVLNVADFSCFLTSFAAGEPYANCDGSTAPPVLNIYDFVCFVEKVGAGCP